MLKTIDKGVRKKGVVTTNYPADGFQPYDGYLGAPALEQGRCDAVGECARACPVEAIRLTTTSLEIDLARCIFCGACARACPNLAMSMSQEFELATKNRKGMVRAYVISR